MPVFEIQERAARPALVVRLSTSVDGIPAALAEALPEAWDAAEALGVAPDGPPFTRYLTEPAGTVEYEAGVTVPGSLRSGLGRAVPTELPGGLVAVAWHVGPYETLGDTYRALVDWIAGQGRTIAGPMWEVYWSDPDSEPPERWRTEVIVPVA
jgi:effector-binding domain-containing protein